MLAARPINAVAWIDLLHSKRNACNARYHSVNDDTLWRLLDIATVEIKNVPDRIETPEVSQGYGFVGSSISSVRLQSATETCSAG